ncbi:MAG: nucleotidyltransferase family protein [Clostridia bacterium]|nr:nucleotidyltransferase family protein [Clostridia bacterium]
MNTLYNDVLYLLACAVNKVKADKNRIESMDLDALYTLCKEHSITALVSYALAEHLKEMSSEQYARWSAEQMKAVYRDMNFAAERANILSFLEENGIWYMPLKGIILKEYYPRAELREFADNDILFDADFEKQVEQYMLSHGYQRKLSDSGQVMEYEKAPCFNFEMHRALYHPNNTVLYAYYKDVKERLIKDSDNAFGYHFSEEDFYVFMISHALKHYKNSGIGIRFLIDIYVYNRAKSATMDTEYIARELEKIEADAFESEMRMLAQTAFGTEDADFTPEQENILEYVFQAGTYGTADILAQNRMKNKIGTVDTSPAGRRRYWANRLFDMERCKVEYPRIYKTKILIPFLILFRAIKGLTKIKSIKEENENLKKLQ